MRRFGLLGIVLLLLCLAGQAEPAAKPHEFWKLDSERSGAATVSSFSARKPPHKGQGLLMCAVWPKDSRQPAELEPTEVLAGLYSELKDFQLLGSKEALWGGQPARLIAFKAKVDKRHVVGRSLLAQTPEGTEILLLVTNHEMQSEFHKEFERMQKAWSFGRPATSNVLYSH